MDVRNFVYDFAIILTRYCRYEPCPRPQFEEEVFTHVYEHANDPEGISPHRLALVFAILSHGVLTDLSRQPYSAYAEQLHQLARASLAASPFLQGGCVALPTLLLLAHLPWKSQRSPSFRQW
jgi:hypothetical protein